MKKRKRRLRKPIRRVLQTLVFTPAAALADITIISYGLATQERFFWVMLIGLCLAANAWLAHEIYEKSERRGKSNGRRENSIRRDIAA